MERACVNCGRDKGACRERECAACAQYRRAYGVARPYTGDGRTERRGDGPTVRQRQVWRLLAQGQTDKQIARALSISAQTVKNHCNALYEYLAVGDGNPRVQAAVRWAMEGRDRAA